MSEPLLSMSARESLERFVAKPSHALLLVAPVGAGKTTVANYLAGRLLDVPTDKLSNQPYFKFVSAPDNKSISIETVRDITHFLTLRTAGKADTARVVVIEHAQAMTVQAQNALLKTIEEPPAGTTLILTAPSELDVLPTIRSRAQCLNLTLPSESDLLDYFHAQGYEATAIKKALVMSGGLPGLTQALLADDQNHPLVQATGRARDILQKSTFERLLMIDDLVKQKDDWLNTLFILSRMADIALSKDGASAATIKRWHTVLAASHEAYSQTTSSAQIKLAAMQFLLAI